MTSKVQASPASMYTPSHERTFEIIAPIEKRMQTIAQTEFSHYYLNESSVARTNGLDKHMLRAISEWTPEQWEGYSLNESKQFRGISLHNAIELLESKDLADQTRDKDLKAAKVLDFAKNMFTEIDSNPRLSDLEKIKFKAKVLDTALNNKYIKRADSTSIPLLDRLKTLNNIAKQWNPRLTMEAISQVITKESIRDIFIEKHLLETTPIDEETYANMLIDLDSMKTTFGAKTITPRPTLTSKTNRLGINEDIWRANLGKIFGIGSDYEYISRQIQGFAEIGKYHTEIASRLNESIGAYNHLLGGKEEPAGAFMARVSGLALHGSANKEIVGIYLEQAPTLLAQAYQDAKEKGTLATFFKEAFDKSNVCFEARYSLLQEYIQRHPFANQEAPAIDTKLVIDYDSKTATKEKVIGSYLAVFRELQVRSYYEENFPGDEMNYISSQWDTKREEILNNEGFTEEYITADKFREYMSTQDLSSLEAFEFDTSTMASTGEKSLITTSDINAVIELYEALCIF
jgi:hypothetical protein